MLADDILALLKIRPMTSEELAKELKRTDPATTEIDVLVLLHGELRGLLELEAGGKWKRKILNE
jgi:hypothetical protein